MKSSALLAILGLAVPTWAQEAPDKPLIEVEHYAISVEIETDRSFLRGQAEIRFSVLQETLAVPFRLNRQLSVTGVTDPSGLRYSLRADDFSRDSIRVQSDVPFRQGELRQLRFEFEGLLEKEQYAFLDVPSTQRAVIDRDGARLLSEGNWFPSYRLLLDAATVELKVTVPLGFTGVGPGVLAGIETLGLSEAFTWRSDEPLTAVPAMVGRYLRHQDTSGSTPLTFYVLEEVTGDLSVVAAQINEILEFYREEFGVIPIQHLTVVQAGNISLGVPGARGLLLLENRLLEAAALPVMTLARRLALQWWGFDLRLARPADAWLSDGFATYAGLRYLQARKPELFAAELARQAVEALKYQDTSPISGGLNLEVGSPKYDSIVAAKGAWVLYMLGQLTEPDRLREIVKGFYDRYAGSAATVGDFSQWVKEQTGTDYRWFFVQWVESVGVPEFRVDYTIFKLKSGGYKIRGQVRQNLELFRMPLDINIETKGQAELKHLDVSGKTTSFTFETETQPVRLELDPAGKILMDSERMRVAVAIAIGDEYREAGEYVSALQEYEKAVSLNPRSSLAHFRLGQTFFEQHSYSNAANSMRDSLNGDLKPEWVETWAHIYLGKIYDILGQRQRARAEYQKAINTGNDYNGAQAEAKRYLEEPFNKPSAVLG
jgi:tetratricopeptide (TPR) repeat protein